MESNYIEAMPTFVHFDQADELNQELKKEHYEERNLNKVRPLGMVALNEEIEHEEFEMLKDDPILSICPWVSIEETMVIFRKEVEESQFDNINEDDIFNELSLIHI